MNIFITGIAGFVGQHLRDYFLKKGFSVTGIAKTQTSYAHICDINDTSRMADLLLQEQPDRIIHLAAISNVAGSFETERLTHEINYMGTLSLLQAARKATPKARILFVSSGQVYESASFPITETGKLEPLSPYASSKLAAEVLCLEFYCTKKMHTVVARSFNHIGSGQDEGFFIPSTLKQIKTALSSGQKELVLNVGNLTAIRDFLSVQDVCEAYSVLLEKGQPGKAYNVASGKGYSIREVIDIFAEVSGLKITINQDPARVRTVEKPSLIGNASELINLGWRQSQQFRDILKKLIHP